MKKYVALCVIGLLIAGCSPVTDESAETEVQTPDMVSPKSVGFSTDRLSRLDAYMQYQVDAGQVAGIQILISRRGKVAFFNSVGMADVKASVPVDQRTIFGLDSMTKPITSVAVMMLYEQGRFLLTDPISKYLPELADLRVYVSGEGDEIVTRPASREVTIQDLLRHTAGMTYEFIGHTQVAASLTAHDVNSMAGSAAQFVTNVAKTSLIDDPGSRWEYSGGTNVLARLVEAISGQNLDVYFRENIFEPLGMSDTTYFVDASKIDRLSAHYEKREDGSLKQFDQGPGRYGDEPDFKMGDQGLTSTTIDYYRFSQMLLNGGELDGVRLLGSRTVAFMTRDHLTPQTTRQWVLQPGHGFGLGFDVLTNRVPTGTPANPGTYFWMGGAGAVFWVDPVDDLIVVLMVQVSPPLLPRMRAEVEALVYQAIVD
jgi:CubicO group peptidase (beta-lactamase class C family)